MANIQDVARRAGVSASTVSNVINGRTDQMRKDTLSRIQAAIVELGYRPNRAAQQLKTGQTSILGLLVPSIVNPSFAALARAVDIAAQDDHGYRVLLGNTYRQKEKEETFFEDLLSHGVKGVIVVSAQIELEHFRTAINRGLVMMNYDGRTKSRQPADGMLIDSVSMNNFEAGRIAALHLIENGCRRVAFVTESGKTISRQDKIEGFLSVVSEAGATVVGSVIEGKAVSSYGDSEMAELGKTLAETISGMDDRPDGIVAINDMLAIGMIAGFRSRGVKIPEDISIVGIDDMFLSALVTPAITSVSPPIAAMAKVMVDRLIARFSDPSIPVDEFLFAPTLVSRESVALHRR